MVWVFPRGLLGKADRCGRLPKRELSQLCRKRAEISRATRLARLPPRHSESLAIFCCPTIWLLRKLTALPLLTLSLDLVVGSAASQRSATHTLGASTRCRHSLRQCGPEPLTLISSRRDSGRCRGSFNGSHHAARPRPGAARIELAIVQLFSRPTNKTSTYTGGSDGLAGLSVGPLLGIFEFDLWGGAPAYLFGRWGWLLVALKFIVASPFGMLCRGIKEDPCPRSRHGCVRGGEPP